MNKFIKSLGKVLAFPLAMFLLLTGVALLPISFVEAWLNCKLELFIEEKIALYEMLKLSWTEAKENHSLKFLKHYKLESSSGKSIEYLLETVYNDKVEKRRKNQERNS